MQNNRIQYIDRLKGFAIILVVMGHWLEANNYNLLSLTITFVLVVPITFISVGVGKVMHKVKVVDRYIYRKIS